MFNPSHSKILPDLSDDPLTASCESIFGWHFDKSIQSKNSVATTCSSFPCRCATSTGSRPLASAAGSERPGEGFELAGRMSPAFMEAQLLMLFPRLFGPVQGAHDIAGLAASIGHFEDRGHEGHDRGLAGWDSARGKGFGEHQPPLRHRFQENADAVGLSPFGPRMTM